MPYDSIYDLINDLCIRLSTNRLSAHVKGRLVTDRSDYVDLCCYAGHIETVRALRS